MSQTFPTRGNRARRRDERGRPPRRTSGSSFLGMQASIVPAKLWLFGLSVSYWSMSVCWRCSAADSFWPSRPWQPAIHRWPLVPAGCRWRRPPRSVGARRRDKRAPREPPAPQRRGLTVRPRGRRLCGCGSARAHYAKLIQPSQFQNAPGMWQYFPRSGLGLRRRTPRAAETPGVPRFPILILKSGDPIARSSQRLFRTIPIRIPTFTSAAAARPVRAPSQPARNAFTARRESD